MGMHSTRRNDQSLQVSAQRGCAGGIDDVSPRFRPAGGDSGFTAPAVDAAIHEYSASKNLKMAMSLSRFAWQSRHHCESAAG